MLSMLEHTPLPMLPAFDAEGTAPMAPKRSRRTSATLNRRVRANLNILCIPDINAAAPLQLQPQGRAMAGTSYEKILLGGAMRNKASKAQLILSSKSKLHCTSPTSSLPWATPLDTTSLPAPPALKANTAAVKKNSNATLLSLRMAAMLKVSADAKAQLKFGGNTFNKSFQAPGRSRSSPYRPSRNAPMRNRSFNALCA